MGRSQTARHTAIQQLWAHLTITRITREFAHWKLDNTPCDGTQLAIVDVSEGPDRTQQLTNKGMLLLSRFRERFQMYRYRQDRWSSVMGNPDPTRFAEAFLAATDDTFGLGSVANVDEALSVEYHQGTQEQMSAWSKDKTNRMKRCEKATLSKDTEALLLKQYGPQKDQTDNIVSRMSQLKRYLDTTVISGNWPGTSPGSDTAQTDTPKGTEGSSGERESWAPIVSREAFAASIRARTGSPMTRLFRKLHKKK